jgi:hypothetical protein
MLIPPPPREILIELLGGPPMFIPIPGPGIGGPPMFMLGIPPIPPIPS